MFYDRLLAAGFILFNHLFIKRFKVAECIQAGGKKASSFAIFGLRVAFVRIANVLDLVRWLARTYQLIS